MAASWKVSATIVGGTSYVNGMCDGPLRQEACPRGPSPPHPARARQGRRGLMAQVCRSTHSDRLSRCEQAGAKPTSAGWMQRCAILHTMRRSMLKAERRRSALGIRRRDIRLQGCLPRSQTQSEGRPENVMTDIAPCEIIDPPPLRWPDPTVPGTAMARHLRPAVARHRANDVAQQAA
jgi:hypothetical protein